MECSRLKSIHAGSSRTLSRSQSRSQTAKQGAHSIRGWTDYIRHVGSALDCRSIAAGLLAGRTSGNEVQKRASSRQWTLGTSQTKFHRMTLINQGYCIILHKLETSSRHSLLVRSGYLFDLELAQSKLVVFWQTMPNAIKLNNSMPADCLEDATTTYFNTKNLTRVTTYAKGRPTR